VIADAEERLEVDPLATEAGRRAVTAAEGALGDEYGVADAEAVLLHERAERVGEGGAAVHRLDREVARGELALAARREEVAALLEHEGEAFLIVDASRGADLEDGEARVGRASARDRMGLDLVHHGALDVLVPRHASGGDEDVVLAGRRERGERRLHDHRERQLEATDLLAHAREERARDGRVARQELFGRAPRLGGGCEPLVSFGHPASREDGRLAGRLRAERSEASPGQRAEHRRTGLAGERRLDLELACARGIELREGMRFGGEALPGPRQRLAKQRVIRTRVGPARVDRLPGLERRDDAGPFLRCIARDHGAEQADRADRFDEEPFGADEPGRQVGRPALANGWPLDHARNRAMGFTTRGYARRHGVASFSLQERGTKATSDPANRMKKNYVLDTNILLHDPNAIFRFDDNNVIIPIYVIEEVDQFKREGSERGRNARHVVRLLDDLRETGGSLSKGVKTRSGGFLRVAIPNKRPELPTAIDKSAMDNAILQTAFQVRDEDVAHPTVFVTMDTNLRIRADALGMLAETYENQRVEVKDGVETGVTEIEVSAEEIDSFFQDGSLAPNPSLIAPERGEKIDRSANTNGDTGVRGILTANLCVLLRDRANPSHTALGRYDATKREIIGLRTPREGLLGIRPRNKEQSHALDLLLDENIRLVTLVGKAGTGKTLLALAAGLKRTVEDGMYTRMLVSRPVMPLGRDIGFLPGDVDEKLNPWMQPIFDNLEFLFSSGTKKGPRAYAELLESGQLQVEPLTYIRGRSLPQQYIIVDEAQNLTPHEVKTIITRSGDGTKIVLTGDPGQIDNPYVDSQSNGLAVAADRFRGEKVAAHIVLTRGERSELAEIAANLL
jgi:PhoH-like ATPase